MGGRSASVIMFDDMASDRAVEKVSLDARAPYVFVNEKRKAPSFVQAVRLMQREVMCHGCSARYFIPAESTAPELGEVACPDCHAPPKPWRIGPPEEIEVAVHVAMGDLVDLTVLRTIGKVSRRVIGAVIGSAFSQAIVTPAPRLWATPQHGMARR